MKFIKQQIIQLNFNLLDLRILNKEIISYIKKEKIGTIARTIYCFGVFTEKFLNNWSFEGSKFPNKNDHRNRWNKDQFESWVNGARTIKENLNKNLKIENIATRFPNSFDFISSSLIGVQSLKELKNNLNKKNFFVLNKKMIKKIINVNKKNFFILKKSPQRIIK